MNPYPASLMRPQERRAELCRLLALGLVRLRMRLLEMGEVSDLMGDRCLHSPPHQSAYATPTHRRNA